MYSSGVAHAIHFGVDADFSVDSGSKFVALFPPEYTIQDRAALSSRTTTASVPCTFFKGPWGGLPTDFASAFTSDNSPSCKA